ncbi:xanthine dehydrogenase family protein molybdopterin-binding subunit [Acidithrix sp. C25]|uniref:xanthine dehydrogenase family protein molybdopterin-binding subunit n=1 Tax=Acidithrix sp. C25 TaxID=1671482 RepID=UPI00191BBBDB|nr:xanthine dehydrogenase family protein molybdopterin-binding subunit [Acidithrix sp. C25]CAG4920321.1 unnamed protein product [Acidithrix sp. C25]
MNGSILGTRVIRLEDPELLKGRATYVDNLEHPGALYCYFVRSTVAAAKIASLDVARAKELPGVRAVLVASDYDIEPFVPFFPLNEHLKRPVLASGVVKFVGDPIAMIIAADRSTAVDASELVEVEYEPLDAVVDMEDALSINARQIDPEVARNLVASVVGGNIDNPLNGAEVVVRGRFENQRMSVAPMEPNSIAVNPDGDGDEGITVWVSTQMPHVIQTKLSSILSIPKDSLRVITPNVGGGFGGKAGVIQEHVAVVGASLMLGIPLRWMEERGENLISMQGRGQVQYVEMAISRDGLILGLDARMVGDAGAYGGFGGGLVAGSTRSMAQGVYSIPKIRYKAAVASTNTPPIGALRGAGRPEATAFLERIVDMAAAEISMDPIEFRRKNLISSTSFPYQSVMGPLYDSGNFVKALDAVAEVSKYQDLRREQLRRRQAGETVVLGIGVSCYVEVTAGGGASEYGAVDITPDGGAEIRVGTSGHGQGHPTTFSMLVADTLKIPLEKIKFIQSDTKEVPRGGGTGGSRSLQLGGSAVNAAALQVLDVAKNLAASHFEASVDDIIVSQEGTIGVAGSPSHFLSWTDLMDVAKQAGVELAYRGDFNQAGATFPFGAHVSVVEVDLETGLVRPISHFAVDDCGRVLNPLVVEGQQHGGIAQGIGQALYEKVYFDAYGNPLNSSFAEYLVPSAAEMPNFVASNTETPSPLNPLGAKGIGESATVGSTPAVQNAVVDALSHLGVRHIDMPMTPERVWQAISQGSNGPLWSEPPSIFSEIKKSDSGSAPEEVDI